MSPEEVRQHADRLAPLQAVFWTPWQALAWAVHSGGMVQFSIG
jgi:hypothetical protein